MFRQSRKRRTQERRIDSVEVDRHVEYPYRLSFYTTPPQLEITIEEFEQWAIDRLRVLGEIESCQLRNKSAAETEKHMKSILDKYMPLSFKSSTVDLERKKDHYSHFILRLAFCRSAELRARFVSLETALFKIRYNTDDSSLREAFISSLDFSWETVSSEEIADLGDKLTWNSSNSKEFFKVDFEQVPDLVATRMVTLHQGKAYIPTSLRMNLVVSEFEKRLEKVLEVTARAIPRLDEDDRLIPILNHLALGMPTQTYVQNASGEGYKAEQVPGLANKHFPLCMKHMNNVTKAESHAKYDVRQQYGAFLKGIGLSVEESLRFWRGLFKGLTDEDFRKKYAYNVRHMYALEGSRIDFKPMDCLQIIRSNGAGSSTHGCPYRTFSESNLVTALQKMGITNKQDLAKIKQNVDEKKYHVACTRVYELTHPNDANGETITHPNLYFDRSVAYEKAKS
ncbi:DNA primase large subunit [Trichomonascus vanleenenianus]|uniref:DNA primase subunit PRI2 n=1 Tax=Trichomonascus vanleenenianus TaxID=2268995 RepID=UPI003EC9C207